MQWAYLSAVDQHAAGLAALAALSAVVIGPALQTWGAVKQGRSQAIAAFSSNLTHGTISDVAKIIRLATELYDASGNDLRSIERQLYEAELRVSLVVGRSTVARRNVSDSLDNLKAGAKGRIASDEMEEIVTKLQRSFETLLAEERKKVRKGK